MGLNTGTVQAGPPEVSIVPAARPWTRALPSRPDAVVLIRLDAGVQRSIRPVARPGGLNDGAIQVASAARVTETRKPLWIGGNGNICGAKSIKGTRVDPVRGPGACGILNPVRVTEVEGVQMSTPIIVDCPTAVALAEWVRNGVKPAIGKEGGGVAVLKVAGSYSCRPRNNQAGARLSEHASGRAVDISGFQLHDGKTISVLRGWRERATRRTLRKIHAVACGPFGTVLGPGADRHHQDHFHLDTASHRNGSYCR